jgi:hypothetical protein
MSMSYTKEQVRTQFDDWWRTTTFGASRQHVAWESWKAAALASQQAAPFIGDDAVTRALKAADVESSPVARQKMRRALEAAFPQQAAVAAPEGGWRLVPVEPTPEMRKAAADAWLDCGSKLILNKAFAALAAGIAAAPEMKEGA